MDARQVGSDGSKPPSFDILTPRGAPPSLLGDTGTAAAKIAEVIQDEAEYEETENNVDESQAAVVRTDGHPAKVESHPRAPASTAEEVVIIVDKLLECPDDEDLHIRALRSLRRISTTQEGRELIGDYGGIQIIADCIGRFGKNNDNLAAMCCVVVANLSFRSEGNKDKVRRSRIIDFIFELLRRERMSAEEMSHVCLAAQNVTSGNLKNQVYMGAYGGIEALCLALKRHMGHVELVVQALGAFGNIARGGKTCQMKIREGGGVELIVRAMRERSENLEVQEKCAMALRNLCDSNDRNSRVVGSLGGVDQIVMAMKSFSSEAALQTKSCAALRFLAFDEENRERLGKNGGVVCIVEAISVTHASGHGLDEVLKALSNATFDHNENKLVVGRCGGVETIMSILSNDASAATVEGGCRVLRNLTDCSEDLRRGMREAGVMTAAVDFLRTRRDEETIVEHTAALLLNLLVDGVSVSGFSRQCDSAEVVELCEEAMRQLPHAPAVTQYATALVSLLRRPVDRDAGPIPGRQRFKNRRMPRLLKKLSRSVSEAPDEVGPDSPRTVAK